MKKVFAITFLFFGAFAQAISDEQVIKYSRIAGKAVGGAIGAAAGAVGGYKVGPWFSRKKDSERTKKIGSVGLGIATAPLAGMAGAALGGTAADKALVFYLQRKYGISGNVAKAFLVSGQSPSNESMRQSFNAVEMKKDSFIKLFLNNVFTEILGKKDWQPLVIKVIKRDKKLDTLYISLGKSLHKIDPLSSSKYKKLLGKALAIKDKEGEAPLFAYLNKLAPFFFALSELYFDGSFAYKYQVMPYKLISKNTFMLQAFKRLLEKLY